MIGREQTAKRKAQMIVEGSGGKWSEIYSKYCHFETRLKELRDTEGGRNRGMNQGWID